jgi:hypothetical protein
MAVKICHGQMSSSLCRNYSEVSGTKINILTNCERSERRNEGAVRWGSVPENNLLHSLYCGVDDAVVGIQGIEPRLKMSVQSHGMR